jgi:hypothetical protein
LRAGTDHKLNVVRQGEELFEEKSVSHSLMPLSTQRIAANIAKLPDLLREATPSNEGYLRQHCL